MSTSAAAQPIAAPSVEADRTSSQFVLLIESIDDEAQRVIGLFDSLGLKGKVERVRSAEEAIDFVNCKGAYADRVRRKPVVVVANPPHPDVVGASLLRELRADRLMSIVPIVVLTGSANAKRPSVPGEVANGYMRKPLGAASVMSCWRYWTSIEQLPRF